jgi:hypothetical protein
MKVQRDEAGRPVQGMYEGSPRPPRWPKRPRRPPRPPGGPGAKRGAGAAAKSVVPVANWRGLRFGRQPSHNARRTNLPEYVDYFRRWRREYRRRIRWLVGCN